jgi:hypothetical protein
MKPKITYVVVALNLLLFIGLGVNNVNNSKHKLQINTIKLKSTEAQLIELNAQYDELLKSQTHNQAEKEQQLKKIQELENEKKRLESELQAKRQQYLAQSQKLNTAAQNASGTQKVQAAGSKLEWLKASGIPESEWQYVDYIISKESGWNPLARNASSGAGGLPQALPYSKTGCAWGDAVCQLKWANSYAISRYGSWARAYNFWVSNRYW